MTVEVTRLVYVVHYLSKCPHKDRYTTARVAVIELFV